MDDDLYMRAAIDAARRGIRDGQSPFGAVIVRAGRVLATDRNTVWLDRDSTAHAEINAVRAAQRRVGRPDLSDAVLYSTCEPCPMCLAAIHWAKIARVVFGATIADASAAGFSEMPIPAAKMAQMGRSRLVVEGKRLHAECVEVFDEWRKTGARRSY